MSNSLSISKLAGILILAIGFISLSSGSVLAQKKYKLMGKKYKAVKITDPGELYSTYDFEDEEASELKKTLGAALFENINANHTETTWPEKFGDFDTRIDNEEKTKAYKVFLVAELGEKNILVVPAKYNKGMGDGYTSSKDFYIVIGNSGLSK